VGLAHELWDDVETLARGAADRRAAQYLHHSPARCDVAERLERELGEEQICFIDGCQRDWDRLPPPDGPLTVGIDGRFLRAPHKEGHFEVIAGKSMLSFRRHEDGDQGESGGKCFAFVQTFDQKPKLSVL
jgi:hypothetical protein